MGEPVVSVLIIHRHAEICADAGRCPRAACPWPLDSAAGQAFVEHVDALQNAEHSNG